MKVGCGFLRGVEVAAADRAAATVRRGGYPQSALRLTAPSAEGAFENLPNHAAQTPVQNRQSRTVAKPFCSAVFCTIPSNPAQGAAALSAAVTSTNLQETAPNFQAGPIP